MWLRSDSFSDGGPIPEQFAMGKHDPESKATFSDNKNPHLTWGNVPEGTESIALIVVDSVAPTVGDDVNKEGRTVSADLPRGEFFHWVLVDVPPSVDEIEAGTHSDGVVPGGKGKDTAIEGARHGLNSYTEWFSGDAEMGGEYYGYDGPFPPWNDELTHEYGFTVYALDQRVLDLGDTFDAADARRAMEGHILDSATIKGTYRINPN